MERVRWNRWMIWVAVLVLVILHQDYWQWNRSGLLLGFLPYPLAYHAGLSLLAALVWWIAATFFWPADLEFEATEAVAAEAAGTGGGHDQPGRGGAAGSSPDSPGEDAAS